MLTSKDIPCREIRIKAKSTNTGIIYIGSNLITATKNTIKLYADDDIIININNTKKVYCLPSIANEGVNYTYIK